MAPARAAGQGLVADESRQVWDGNPSCDGESGAEIVPERDAELGAGFGEAE